MKIVSTNVYVGPNVWASFPVIRHVIDLGVLEDWPSVSSATALIDALGRGVAWSGRAWLFLPRPGGLSRRLREDEGTWMAHIRALALENQGGAGAEVSASAARGAPAFRDNTIWSTNTSSGMWGCDAGQLAIRLLMHILPDTVKTRSTSNLIRLSTLPPR